MNIMPFILAACFVLLMASLTVLYMLSFSAYWTYRAGKRIYEEWKKGGD